MVQANKEYNQELIEKLISHFGVTDSKNNGGYILPDGSLLNLNRTDKSIKQYHREVAALLPEEMQGICDEITIINLMTATGAIRYEAKGRVHVAAEPTQQQRRKLFDIMKYSEHDYLVFVSDQTSATIGEARFKSPQAHELLEFFNHCFKQEAEKRYRDDEFAIEPETDGFALIFRTSGETIAHFNKADKQFTIKEEFSGIQSFFEQKITNYRE